MMRSHRPILLVLGTVIANLVFLLLSPSTMVPPRLSEQMDKALLTLGLSLAPFAWGFYLLFTYRNSKERILAYLAIAVSLVWIGSGTNFVIQVMKDRRIHRSMSDTHFARCHARDERTAPYRAARSAAGNQAIT